MGRVEGKVAIVTGGASGLGESSVRLLIREGAKVVIADINESAGEALADSLGGNAIFIPLDVTKENVWIDVVNKTNSLFGRLDVLVNNAGAAVLANVEDTTVEDYRFVMGTCADSVFFGCKYAIPVMRESGGGGSIINISSLSGIGAYPFLFAYSAAKAAISGMTKSVAAYCAERGDKIRCNIIYPGGIDTPGAQRTFAKSELKHGEERAVKSQLGKPDDVGYAVLYFASDESEFVSGAELVIDDAKGAIWVS